MMDKVCPAGIAGVSPSYPRISRWAQNFDILAVASVLQ
jgi:hypothetical protein